MASVIFTHTYAALRCLSVKAAPTFLQDSQFKKPLELHLTQSLTCGNRAQPLRFPIYNCNYPISLLKGSATSTLWKDYLSESVLHIAVLVTVIKTGKAVQFLRYVWKFGAEPSLSRAWHKQHSLRTPLSQVHKKKTYIPTSQIISWVAGDSKSFSRTWNECKSVSDS